MTSISPSGNKRPGFALIEILIVIAIMAIFATVLLPRLAFRKAGDLDELIEHVNRFTRLAYVRSIVTGKVHRLFFHVAEKSELKLEVESGKTSAGVSTFAPVAGLSMPTVYHWGKELKVVNFYIKNIDENKNNKIKDAWFFVFPVGITQDIILNLEDSERGERCGLVLNPFSAKFLRYDTFQTP